MKSYFRKFWLFLFSVFLVLTFFQAFAKSYSYVDCKGVPLDQKLVQLMNFRNGIFIEAGANDGLIQSNTKLFEQDYGWRGLLIEPSAILFDKLRKNRPFSLCYQCALGSFEQENTFVYGDFDGGLMSSVSGVRFGDPQRPRIMVPVRSLQSLLDEAGIKHVNFFSLDTEGYEFNILNGIDFNKTEFDYLLIEIYQDQYEKIVSFLAKNGYDLVECFTNYNKKDNPMWDGSHNDYLFRRSQKELK